MITFEEIIQNPMPRQEVGAMSVRKESSQEFPELRKEAGPDTYKTDTRQDKRKNLIKIQAYYTKLQKVNNVKANL